MPWRRIWRTSCRETSRARIPQPPPPLLVLKLPMLLKYAILGVFSINGGVGGLTLGGWDYACPLQLGLGLWA